VDDDDESSSDGSFGDKSSCASGLKTSRRKVRSAARALGSGGWCRTATRTWTRVALAAARTAVPRMTAALSPRTAAEGASAAAPRLRICGDSGDRALLRARPRGQGQRRRRRQKLLRKRPTSRRKVRSAARWDNGATTFDALSDKSKITVYGDAFTNVTQTNVAKMGKPGRSGCGAVNGARCTLLSYVPAEKPGEKVGERDLPSPGGGVRRRLLLQQPKLLRVKLDNPNLMRGQRIGTLDYVYGVIQAVVSTLCV
jgi:hypothetical protein